MAQFDTSGLDDLIMDMNAMGESTGELAEEMLFAGAAEVKKAWKRSAEMHKHRDTGDLINSIGYPRTPRQVGDIKEIDIYPQGKNRKGVRTAEVAFVLHYGTSRRKGSHWVDDADEIAGPLVERRLLDIYDDWLAERGMK